MSNLQEEFDHTSGRHLIVYRDKSAFLANNGNIAQIGHSLSKPLKNGSLGILLNHTLESVGISSDYRLSVKTAEYHSYIDIHNLRTNEHVYFGGATAREASWGMGDMYIRNDSYYEHKYYKGFVYHHPHQKHFDRASHSVTFAINQIQAHAAISYANQKIEQSKHTPDFFSIYPYVLKFKWATYYPTVTVSKNCHDFASEVLFHARISEVPAPAYLRFDEIITDDQGVLYNLLQLTGYINPFSSKHSPYFYEHIFRPKLFHYFFQSTFFKAERYHFSDKELEKLFVMSESGSSVEELEQQLTLIDPEQLNTLHSRGFTSALLETIKRGDAKLFKLLINSPKVDIEIRDSNGDNIAQIAKYSGQNEFLEEILLKNFDLLTEYNHDTQPPICSIRDCTSEEYAQYLVNYHDYHHPMEYVPYI